jgi:hypothetical protein
LIITGRVSLPLTSFYTAWLALNLGEPPTALLPARGVAARPGDTVSSVADRSWEDLFERELATGHRLDDDFAHTLRVLATAARTYYAFYHQLDEDSRSALVVGAKVLATIHADIITLRPVWSTGVPLALVRALPSAPKGLGESLSASVGELDAVPDRENVTTRRPTGHAAQMRWLLGQRRVGGGQLYAARRDRQGRRVVCPRPLSYFDIAAGRYLATEEPASDGTSWRTIIPADTTLIAERLHALLPTHDRI